MQDLKNLRLLDRDMSGQHADQPLVLDTFVICTGMLTGIPDSDDIHQ